MDLKIVFKCALPRELLHCICQGFSTGALGQPPLVGHEQRPLLNITAVNTVDEQGATSVENLWKVATNHE